MENVLTFIKAMFATVGGWIGYFLGDIDGLVMTLLAFIVIDYATGIMCAISTHTLSSEIGFKGLAKKAFILLIVGMAHLLDVRFQHGDVLRGAVCLFYLANEGISILENANVLGLPLPKGMKKIFEKMKDESEKTIDPDRQIDVFESQEDEDDEKEKTV